MNQIITVYKLNPQREETWHYQGKILHWKAGQIILEAFFDREDRPFHGLMLGKGDRFLELYSSEDWFNIFEIHDRSDDHLKGWYCNVTMPAEFSPQAVSYVDLALDLLVFPDGRQLVLDEDEFAVLSIDDNLRKAAREGLRRLQEIFLKPQNFRLEDFFHKDGTGMDGAHE